MDSSIIGVLGTVLGVLIAGPITYYFSSVLVKETHKNAMNIIQTQEFYRAAGIFRAKVLNELEGLYPVAVDWPEGFSATSTRFNSIFPKLQIAVAEFSPILPKSERAAFEKAWKNFHVSEESNKTEKQYYWQFQPRNSARRDKNDKLTTDIITLEESKSIFKHGVDSLLSFAKPA